MPSPAATWAWRRSIITVAGRGATTRSTTSASASMISAIRSPSATESPACHGGDAPSVRRRGDRGVDVAVAADHPPAGRWSGWPRRRGCRSRRARRACRRRRGQLGAGERGRRRRPRRRSPGSPRSRAADRLRPGFITRMLPAERGAEHGGRGDRPLATRRRRHPRTRRRPASSRRRRPSGGRSAGRTRPMTWRVRTSAIRSVVGAIGACRESSGRGWRRRTASCGCAWRRPAGWRPGRRSTRPATRPVAACRATARDAATPFELVAVHRAEDGHGRTVDAPSTATSSRATSAPASRHRAGDGRRGAAVTADPPPSASTAATWSRNALSGWPNGGDVVAWAMMPSCTNASLSAPIATPEKLLVARGAS